MLHSMPTSSLTASPLTRARTSFDKEVGKSKRFEIHAVDHEGKSENYADGFGKYARVASSSAPLLQPPCDPPGER